MLHRAFIDFPEGPLVYYSLLGLKAVDNSWLAMSDFTLVAAAIMSDVLMTWRLYVVWYVQQTATSRSIGVLTL
ncbi:hypothetical protein FRB93_013564 [Tulasnella sp. JGI-2019a]|nr:hypothetical protein FRB93_013564 [Tulasnella sp. JGI-2019a]